MNQWCMYTILHVPQLFLIHVPPIYRYTNSLDTVISYIGIIIIWILGTQLYHVHTSLLHMFTAPVYMHVLCLYSCHMDHRSYYKYYCAMLSLYSCYMIIARYWTCELLICDVWNSTSICFPFPVILFLAINKAHVLLSCYMYHVPYLFLIYCVVKDNKYNLKMGRLDGWLYLIGWMFWIHIVSPTVGDGSAGYRLYIAPWAPVSRFLLSS